MKTVNGMVIDALNAIGIWTDTDQSPTSDYTNAALSDLNSLVDELNQQDYIQESRVVKTCMACDKFTIGPDSSCNIVEDNIPNSLKSVARKVGNHYYKLIPVDYATIYSTNRVGLANLFTYKVDADKANRFMYGEVMVDGNQPSEFMVIYNKVYPKYKMDSEVWFTDTTINLLEEGLKYKLALRYKLPDAELFKKEYDDYKHLVEENIGQNNPMTFGNFGQSNYLAGYYNVLGGDFTL